MIHLSIEDDIVLDQKCMQAIEREKGISKSKWEKRDMGG